MRDASELMDMVRHGFSVRSTSATGVHGASSRSHAILRVYIYAGDSLAHECDYGTRVADAVDADGLLSVEGVLTLVDLAGSEHRIDSMHHTAQRRKEGAEINASLMALKSVIHARSQVFLLLKTNCLLRPVLFYNTTHFDQTASCADDLFERAPMRSTCTASRSSQWP